MIRIPWIKKVVIIIMAVYWSFENEAYFNEVKGICKGPPMEETSVFLFHSSLKLGMILG